MSHTNKKTFTALIVTCLILLAAFVPAFAQKSSKIIPNTTQTNATTDAEPRYALLNINNLTAWMRSDGQSAHSPTGQNGIHFPRGTANVIYQDGILWGGKAYVDANKTIPAPFSQLVRVGGATYGTGTRAGWITGQGASAVAADPDDPRARIYRIRRDYFSMPDSELTRDAAELNEIGFDEVTPAQKQAALDQYAKDWSEWPVDLGAPFIDRNGNGIFDPPPPFSSTFTADSLIAGGYDEPGIAAANPNLPADQVIWTVYNDLDRQTAVQRFGSEPLGLELQVTVWGYKKIKIFEDVFFKRIRLINKGGVDTDGDGTVDGVFYLDSLHVAQWSDPDLGTFNDDLVGCDIPLQAGYVYNGSASDAEFSKYNLAPPAAGYSLLHGAILSAPGSEGIFDFRRVRDAKNLGMSAFAYFATGSPYSDPAGSYVTNSLRWWKLLRGYAPLAGPDVRINFPPGVEPGPYPLAGDPVAGTGHIDGQGFDYSFVPGDRRSIIVSGPFVMAPGDTQEAVIAFVAGLGADRLSSISAMRSTMNKVKAFYLSLFDFVPPKFFAEVVYEADPTKARIKIFAEENPAAIEAIKATVRRQDGSTVTTLTLLDDGLHDDGAAGDGVFGNSIEVDREAAAFYLDAEVTDATSMTHTLPRIFEPITTAGIVDISTPVIVSDNLNGDGVANPGENIRYGFTLHNRTPFDLTDLRITPQVQFIPGKSLEVSRVDAGMTFTPIYSAVAPNSYLDFEIPSAFPSAIFNVPILVSDQQFNQWQDTLQFEIVPASVEYQESLFLHIAGRASGDFGIRIIDPQAVRKTEYIIQGVDSINTQGERGFTLSDRNFGRVLLSDHPIPDTLGHNISVTDGFKVLRGTLMDQSKAGVIGWSVPNGNRVWTWANNANGFGFEGFNGAIGATSPRIIFGDGTRIVRIDALKDVLIKFAGTDQEGNVLDPNDPDWSYGYRYGRAFHLAPAKPEFAPFIINPSGGYSYQDFTKSVPFSAWDVEENPPRRLVIGFLENNLPGGLVDGRYWPPDFTAADNTAGSGPREWFFIFDATYSETPDPAFMTELIGSDAPMMYWGTPARRGNIAFGAEDEFMVFASHLVTKNDIWTFDATTVGVENGFGTPETFALSQNYPNPFNPQTTIAFALPTVSHVTLKIFNILGQEITALLDKRLPAGRHVVIWQGSDRFKTTVASGVYFYRLEAEPVAGGQRFVRTRKMAVVR